MEDGMASEGIRSDTDSLFSQGKGLSREQMIDRIRALNPGATPDYLGHFETPALALYLDHLNVTSEPRGTIWRRPGDTPAIVTRNPQD